MTHPTQLKVTSYLKGLVECRARHDAERLRLIKRAEGVAARLEEVEKIIVSVDGLIKQYNRSLDPTTIQPVDGWRGRYGKRGNKLAEIRRFLREAYPESRSTVEVGWAIADMFGIEFDNPDHKTHWFKTSIRSPLHKLAQAGEIKLLNHEQCKTGREAAQWLHILKEEE